MNARVHFAAAPRALRVLYFGSGRPNGARMACEVVRDPNACIFVVKPCDDVNPQTTSHMEQVTCRACRRSPLFASAKREAHWHSKPWPHSLIFYGRRYKCRGYRCAAHYNGAACPRHPLPEPEVPVIVKRVVKMSRTRPARDQGPAVLPEEA